MHTPSSDPTSARGARARRGSIAVIAALATAMLLSACGSSASSPGSTPTSSTPTPTALLNMHVIVRSIEQSILTQRHIHATVTCPAVVPQQQGRNFACIARTRGSTSKTPVVVTQQNNNGYVTYRAE